jgi:peptidoglycan/LPS O-acetylase OafA/YrhL
MNKLKYPSLNGLRAISIILVLFHHLGINNNIFQRFSEVDWLDNVLILLQDGHLGVNIFFVISGFLITSIMMNEEKNTNTISLKNFYLKRAFRILPAFYFLLIVYFRKN